MLRNSYAEFRDFMQELFTKYLNNQCSPEEVRELLAYFNAPENETILRGLITESLKNIDAGGDGRQWNPATDKMFAVIKKKLDAKKGKVVSISVRRWFQ